MKKLTPIQQLYLAVAIVVWLRILFEIVYFIFNK
jgi:hypothetical protein